MTQTARTLCSLSLSIASIALVLRPLCVTTRASAEGSGASEKCTYEKGVVTSTGHDAPRRSLMKGSAICAAL